MRRQLKTQIRLILNCPMLSGDGTIVTKSVYLTYIDRRAKPNCD